MNNRTFSAAARQVSVSCLIAMLYVLIILLNGTPALRFPVILILYSVVIYGINRLFAKKTRTLVQLIAVNAICGAAVFVLLLFTGTFPAVWQGFYGFFSILILTALGAVAVYSPLKLNSILLFMDANILLLLFSVLLIASLPHSFGWVFFSIFGAIAGLLGALSCRMGRPLGKREWSVLLFLFAVIAVIAWLLFAFVVSPLSTGVADVGQAIGSFFVFLGSQIQRFFKFLASLMPEEDGTAAADLQAASASAGQEEFTGSGDNNLMPLIIVGAIIVVLVVIGILVIRKNRKAKIGATKLAALSETEEVKRSSLKEALRKAVEKMRRKLRARRYLSANRNRPEGLYFTLRKICQKTPLAMQKGDTPADFLARIRNAFADDSAEASHLQELSFQVNRNFYAKNPAAMAYPWAAELIRTVRKKAKQKQDKTG